MPAIPEFKPVGKGATSIITPVRASLASESLRDAYIGNELAEIIGDAIKMEEVLLWRDAWKEERNGDPFNPSTPSSPSRFDEVPF